MRKKLDTIWEKNWALFEKRNWALFEKRIGHYLKKRFGHYLRKELDTFWEKNWALFEKRNWALFEKRYCTVTIWEKDLSLHGFSNSIGQENKIGETKSFLSPSEAFPLFKCQGCWQSFPLHWNVQISCSIRCLFGKLFLRHFYFSSPCVDFSDHLSNLLNQILIIQNSHNIPLHHHFDYVPKDSLKDWH